MRYQNLYIITAFLLLVACSNKEKMLNEQIEVVQKSNYELFEGVTIEARGIINDTLRVPFINIEKNGTSFLLPNFDYYECPSLDTTCLESKSRKTFNITEFSSLFNPRPKELSANAFTYQTVKPIVQEFQRLNLIKIHSSSNIGQCIIFELEENTFLVYAESGSRINNDKWKSQLVQKNSIAPSWYLIDAGL